MNRMLTVAALLLMSAPVFAQDMPLSMFLKEGEGWKKVSEGDLMGAAVQVKINGKVVDFPGLGKPTTAIFSPDSATLYLGFSGSRAVWALPGGATGTNNLISPYCPLRLRKGESKLEVTHLTADTAGRIYAATPDGIQVFDPTGRLSGVLLLPEAGSPSTLDWSGEKRNILTITMGEKTYTCVMNATGAK